MQKQHGTDAKNLLLHRLASEIRTRSTLEVLRKGIKANGCKFRVAYFRPASGLNESSQKLYRANVFSIVRQLKYSEKNERSLDLGVFLNGLPISTAELKNPFKQQNVKDGVRQYRLDRDPKEPLFGFGRCLAHLAVDPNLVYVTTHLRGAKTRFLPSKQGHNQHDFMPMNLMCERAEMFERRIYDRTKAVFEYFGLPFDAEPPP